MANEKPLYTLYKGLKADNYDVPDSYERFERTLTEAGKGGAQSRHKLYEALKSQDYDVPDSYERFYSTLFAPVNRTISRAIGGSYEKPQSSYSMQSASTSQGQAASVLGTPAQQPQKPVQKPTAATARPAQKPQQKGTPLSEAEKQKMLGETSQMLAQTDAGLRRTKNRMDYASANTGLHVPKVKLGERGSGIKLGQNSKVVATEPKYDPETGKEEQTFITESGNEFNNRAEADLEQNSVDDARYQLEHREDWLRQQRRALAARLAQRGQELDAEAVDFSWRDMPRGSGGAIHTYNSATSNGRLADTKYKNMLAQIQKIDDTLATLEEARKGIASDKWIDDSSNWAAKKGKQLLAFGAGAWRGLAHAVGKVSTWDMGLTDINTNMNVLDAAQNAAKYGFDNISQDDRDLLNLTAISNEVQSENADHIGRGYKAGEVTGESLPFMIEMILNPASGLGETAVKKMTREAIKRYGKEAVKNATKKYMATKIGTRLLGDAAGSAIMAGTTGQGHVTADMLNRLTGDVQFKVDDTGHIVYDGTEGAEDSVTKAYLKAFGAQTIENHSEMVGEYFAPLLGKASTIVRKGMEKVGLGSVNRFIDNVGATNFAQMIGDFEKHAKWNGTIGEYAEEVVGNIENALLVGDNTLDTAKDTGVFNLDQNIDTFLGVSLMGGFLSGAKTLSYRGPKRQAMNEMSDAGKAIDRAVGGDIHWMEKWGGWRNTFLVGTDEEKKAALREVMDDTNLPINFRMGVLNFVKAAQKYEGLSRAQESKVQNGEQDPVAASYDESYDRGYDTTEPEAMNDAKNMLDMKRQLLAQQLGVENADELDDYVGDPLRYIDEQLKSGNTAELQLVIDYANAKSAYEGMLQRVRDDIDSQVEESNHTVNSHVNRTDGMIHPATLKEQNEDGTDKSAYIVSGNVVMMDDGSGVDTEKSDVTVVIRDAQTGELSQVAPDAIMGMDEAIDPEEEKATAAAAIQQTMAQQAADRVDGTVSFAPGDNYTLTTPDGNQQAITITANEQGLVDNGNGTVNVTVDGQTIVPMGKEEIQQGVDATNMARTAQAEQERLGQQAEAEQQRQAAEAEASRPQYGVNDIFTINDENGMPVRGNVQGITEDGVEIYTEAPLNGKRVQVVPTEEFEGMVDSISDADGNPIWARGDNNNNKPSEASLSLSTPLEEEKAPLVDEATPSNEEAASAEPQPTALERVPKNDKGEPIYEQAEPETAWDAIVEQTGGNEQMAKTVADSMVADKEAALKKAEKAKAKQGGTIAEKIAAEQERQQAIDNAKAELKHWQSIAMTQQRRRADAERVKADEARKAAEARAEEEAKAKAEREEAERKEREAINGVPDWVDDTPMNARARGFRRSGGGKFDRQQPLVDSEYKPTEVAEGQAAPIHVGKEVDVKFTDKVKQKGRVAVVEASSIQPSHYHGQPNVLHFIPEAQPKKRTDDASVTSAEDIAANINPEEITSSVTAYTGAPSLNARGETIQGNNRSAALKQMWESHPEQAAKYKQYLMDHAEEYGLKAEDLARMQQPVLANIMDVDDTKAIELGQYDVKDTESGGTERIKAKNVVVKMGEDMKHFANVLLSSSDDEASFSQLVDKNGTSVLKWMNQKGYITPTQYKSAFDSKGNITAEAANDLKNIMYQSIFTDGNERLEEVFNTLPAKAQRAILATMYRDYDSPEAERMVTEVQNSIMAYNELMQDEGFAGAKNMKEAQMAVMMWQRQYQFDDATGESYLPTDKYSNFALQLAAMYRVQTQSLIQGTFNQMFDLIQGTQETTLFNQDTLDNTPRTLVEAIKEALNIDYNGQQRSNVLVGDSSASQQRRQGSRGAAEADGRGKSGNEPAEREGGTGSNSGQGAISKSNETEDIRQSEKVSEETEESVGRSLTKEEADELLSRMENNAEVSTEKELTAETWNETFDENNSIETPIGRVKMGENQITKFFDKNRTKEFGMVGPTLSNPDVIIEEKSEAKDGDSERQSSFLFVKTFNRNGEKIKFFASITVKQDGLEVSVSSHYLNKNKVSRTMQEGKVLYTREALLPNSSEWRLAEHQENDVPDLLPTQGSNASKNNEGLQNRFDGGAQTEHHPADVSVTTSHENGQGFSSADKVTNKGRELQTNNEKSAGSEQVKLSSKVEAASQEVNTHPTEAQKEAGNYKKGHVQVGTFDITIEQPEGSIRRGTDADGKQWESNMHNTYGYIRGTEGVDGDHIDVFISTDIDGWNGRKVFVVDQYNPDGTFDEHKVMLGFNDMDEAKSDYLANYEKGWENGRRITVSATNLEDFEKWIDSSHRKTKPFSEYSSVNKETVANTPAKKEAEKSYRAALDHESDVEQEWEEKIQDYVAEHYPTQAVLSAESKSEQGLREKEAMRKDAVLKKMREEAKEAADEARKASAAALAKLEEEEDGRKPRLHKAEGDEIEATAKEHGVDATWLSHYAEGMREKNSAAASRALHDIKAMYLREHTAEKKALMEREGVNGLIANKRLFEPIEKAIKAKYGDVDELVEERRKQAEQEHSIMEAARKRAEEEERKREARLEELAGLTDEDIDKRYAEALEKGDEATAREMLDEAARRKGYGDAESDYQGVGAWGAPSKPDYESDEARRNAVGEDSPDLNVEDMAAGYNNQPEDIFVHPKKYSQGLPTSEESGKTIQTAIDDIRSGKKDVKIKVYRALPTSVKEGKLRNGDWVTPNKSYAEMHGENRLDGKYRIIEDEVPANELWWDSNDVNEWGYDNGKSYRYKNAKNNRKLNDLVTRDDKGNVIPPSKRFNSRKADERYQKADTKSQADKREVALRDAVVDRLRDGGMDVSMDADEGQRVLDEVNGKAKMSAKKRRALETASVSREEKHQQTAISSADGAKVLKNLDSLANEYENSPRTKEKTFIGEVADSLGIEAKDKSSKYATFETKSGRIVTIRLSNHNAKVSNFDNRAESEGISIVVSPRKSEGMTNDGEAHVVEYYYDAIKLRRAEGKPLADILRSIKQALYSGEFEDTTGLAERQEVNAGDVARYQKVYHGSGADFDHFDHSHMGEGEGAQAFGWGTYVTEVEGIGQTYADTGFSHTEQRRKIDRNNGSPLEKAVNDIIFQELYNIDVSNFEQRKNAIIEQIESYLSPFAIWLEGKDKKIPAFYREDVEEKQAELKVLRTLTKEQYDEERMRQGRMRHLYTVEIPDDTGENYLDWDKPLSEALVEKVAKALPSLNEFDIKRLKENGTGKDLYRTVSMRLAGDEFNNDEKASKFLSSLGFTGIKYPADFMRGGREDGKKNYVIFNEGDARITDHVRFFRTADGEAYGYTIGGRIYIDPRIANSETPIHEYAHLWATALRNGNAEEWKNVVELMKDTKVWDEVRKRYPELESEDDIADEVLATYSGRRGAERLRGEMDAITSGNGSVFEKAEAVSALERVKEAIRKFWKATADMLHIHFTSAEEVADRVMKDLLDGVDPRKFGVSNKVRKMSFGERYDYDAYPLGRVEPNLSEKEVEVVKADANHGFTNYKEAKVWAKHNITRTYNNEETGGKGDVRISNAAIDKFLSQSAVDKSDSKDVHMAVLKVLPDVLKTSIDVETHPDFLKGKDGKRNADNGINKDVLVHRCYGAVSIDGKPYRVKITLKEEVRNKNLPHNTHSYEATKIELLAGTLVKPEGDNPNTNNSISAAKLLENVGMSYNPSEKVLDASEKRTKDIRDADEDMYRIVDDSATIERLESEPKMTAYRAMQVIDGRLYSPMAAKVDGRLTADNPMGAWTEAEETVFDFTPEQKAAMEKLDTSGKKGNVDIIKGKLRYNKASEGGRGTLQFHLVKGDGTDLWAAYNPYIHSSLMMLNDQFTSAYKRPNIVVVEVEIPKSELTSGYRAEHAKDPVGMAEWKAGPVAGQLPSDMGRKVMLSRWSKVKRIVPYSEVADHVASILQAAEAKKGKKLTLPIDSFHPELRKELEKRGFKFEYGQYTKEKTDKNGNVHKAWDEKSDVEKQKAYNGASYMDDAAIKELNDDFDGKWLKREGDGAYSDEEVSWENDPVSKMLGRNRWSKRRQGEFATRERERMAARVQELADKLHLNNVEVVTDASTLDGKRKRAKGFYNKRSGRITIVIPNHASMADVEQTLLHEAVAHYGLRELFGEQFDTFLDNVYQHAEFDTRQKIAGLARKNGWNFRKATEEYLASLAEDTDFEGMNKGRGFYGWWSFVKQSFLEMLHKIGFGEYDGPQLSDNELRYILWRSYENLKEPGRYRSILGEAEDMSKQMDLKVGNFAEREETHMDKASEEDLFRNGDNVDYEKAQARNLYEERVSRGMYQMQEALQDSMLGLKEAMDAVLKAEGQTLHIEDVAGYENAYLGENRLSSVNQAECEAFARTLFKPLLEEVARLAKTADERAELTDYMMAKHGLERNEVMARRAATKVCNDEFKVELRKAERAAAKDPLDQDAQDRLDDVKQRMHDREEELYFENRSRDYAGLTALTGMDNVVDAETEAERMVKDYESGHDTAVLWGKVFDVTQGTLSKTYESGLINKATYDDIRTMYKHYIPLRGFDEKTSDEAYAYLQDKHSAFNSPIKTANGRKSKADDPFANMESMAESAIMQGNRNVLVKQKFLNFALNHPSDLVSVSDLWLRYDDAADEWKPVNTGDVAGTERLEETDSPADVERKMQTFEEAMEQLAANEPDRWKKQKDNPAIPYRVVESRDLRQHQVLVKRGGKDYLLTINGNPRAAQALNGQTNPDNDTSGAIGAILHAGEVLNRHLSAFYTTRNPDFVVSNFVRDALYANTSVWVKESPNYAVRFHKNFARVNPAKMKMLFGKLRKGTLDMNDETERMFHQFMMNGGETGYSNIRDIEQRKNDIKRELKKYNGKLPIRKAWDLLGERFDEYNRAVENCARFAAYMTSRQMKRSIDRSIYDAKEISVNFNKKGSGAKFMGAVGQTKTGNAAAFVSGLGRSGYVFWNAALQGTTNFGRIAKRHPKKAIAGMAAMFLLGVLAAGIGGDDGDDEDKNSYYNLPEYVRRSNIVFRLPWMKESWISIPLPVEYRSIYGMGELMTSVISGKEHYTGGEIASQVAGQMSQMLPIDFMEGGGSFKAFVPSAVKPYAEVMTNKGWTGMPLYKDTPYNQDMPEWTKAYKSANKYLVGLAETLNDISGGDAYTKGLVDINPAKVEYLLNGYFGGVSTTIDKLTKTAETIFGDREYDPRSFPILNRLMKNGDERTENRAINNEYFRLQKECQILKERLKHYEDDTDNGVFDYAEKIDWLYNSPEYRRLEIFEDYAPDIDAIVKELKEPMSDEERKQLEADLNEIKKELVEEVNETRKRK